MIPKKEECSRLQIVGLLLWTSIIFLHDFGHRIIYPIIGLLIIKIRTKQRYEGVSFRSPYAAPAILLSSEKPVSYNWLFLFTGKRKFPLRRKGACLGVSVVLAKKKFQH